MEEGQSSDAAGGRSACNAPNEGGSVSIFVHRDGASQITVRDDGGRELSLISHDRKLHVTTVGAGPHLTPQMARDLADALHQWADCQQTVRRARDENR